MKSTFVTNFEKTICIVHKDKAC